MQIKQFREGLSLISSITNRGKVRFKVYEGAMNADILIDFMKRLVQEMRKGQLKQAALRHMMHSQKSPQKRKQFFQKDSVKYED